MPPWGGPEGSPPRQGAPNLLLSIVPRRYDTSHHAGGLPQSATSSSASSSESDGNPTQNLGRVEWLLQTTKPLHLLQLPRQPAGITSCFHPYSRSAHIGRRNTGDADDRRPSQRFRNWRRICRYAPKSPPSSFEYLLTFLPNRRHRDTVLQAQAHSRSAQISCCCTWDAYVLRPAPSSSVRDLESCLSIYSQTHFSFWTTLHLFSPSRRHCDRVLPARAHSRRPLQLHYSTFGTLPGSTARGCSWLNLNAIQFNSIRFNFTTTLLYYFIFAKPSPLRPPSQAQYADRFPLPVPPVIQHLEPCQGAQLVH